MELSTPLQKKMSSSSEEMTSDIFIMQRVQIQGVDPVFGDVLVVNGPLTGNTPGSTWTSVTFDCLGVLRVSTENMTLIVLGNGD